MLGLLGYLFPAELAGLLEGLEGFGGYGEFEAWQTAALNAYKRSHCCGRGVPLSHCCGLVVAFACGSGACWACWGTCSLRSWPDFWRVWRVLEGFEAWQTAALNAYKRSHCCGSVVLLSHCCGLVVAFACGSGACTPIRSHCCGRGVLLSHCCGLVVAFACGSGACWACWGTFSLRSWPDFWKVWRVLDGMESLRPGKRQP